MKIRDALLNGPLGFGTAQSGNMFRNNPDEEAPATVDHSHISPQLPSSRERASPACQRRSLNAFVPHDFWRELRKQNLVGPNAPLPIDR